MAAVVWEYWRSAIFVAVDLIGISSVGPGFNGGMNVVDKIFF